jgi:predicted Zn-ribbon and HTH transcriptional regulator
MSLFKGRTAVLATMHGKEEVIVPILEKELGLKIIIPDNFNTDQFGTFTMDIPRAGNQLEAARNKALAAMKTMGIDLGIASEGSFGNDPHIPFIQSNLELILLVDQRNLLEICGNHRSSETNIAGEYVSSVEEAICFAKKIGFPEHGIIIRKSKKSKNGIYKGIRSEADLHQTVSKLLRGIFTRKIYIETDMRAHMNPTRMKKIAAATDDLVLNIKSECPICKTPGFSIAETRRSLKCGQCGQHTDSQISSIRKCQKCKTEREIQIEDSMFDTPSNCKNCNP